MTRGVSALIELECRWCKQWVYAHVRDAHEAACLAAKREAERLILEAYRAKERGMAN